MSLTAIRNILPTPLTLYKVEYFNLTRNSLSFIDNLSLQNPSTSKTLGNITHDITQGFNNFLNSSLQIIGPKSKVALTNDDVPFNSTYDIITVEPFSIQAFSESFLSSGIDGTLSKLETAWRLHFDVGGQKYKYDLLSTANTSKNDRGSSLGSLVPLNEDDSGSNSQSLSAIYFPKSKFISILSSVTLTQWMGQLPDSIPLNAISIPGTHNTAAYFTMFASVQCQAASEIEQMDNGVRFLDLRIQVNDPKNFLTDNLTMVHGAFSVKLGDSKMFREILASAKTFLQNNPTETLIFSMKREGSGSDATDADLAKKLWVNFFSKEPDLWWTQSRIPKLGEIRGKIVLFRRFSIPDVDNDGTVDPNIFDASNWGIDATNWPYNVDFFSNGNIAVQDLNDFKNVSGISRKVEVIKSHLRRIGPKNLDVSVLDMASRLTLPPPITLASTSPTIPKLNGTWNGDGMSNSSPSQLSSTNATRKLDSLKSSKPTFTNGSDEKPPPCKCPCDSRLCKTDGGLGQVVNSTSFAPENISSDRVANSTSPLANSQLTVEMINFDTPLYVNFLSASTFWYPSLWPVNLAPVINPQIIEYIISPAALNDMSSGDWITGIVLADWIGTDDNWDFCHVIVAMNSRVLQRFA